MGGRWMDDDESDGDPSWDDSGDEFDDEDDASDDDTIPCPFCRREIHEDAQRCPYCERYLSEEDAPPARKPWWIIGGTLLCLYIVYRWSVGW